MQNLNLIDQKFIFYRYKLAPEYPSPIPLLDSERATRYLFANAHLYGIDDSNIGVIGK